MCEQLKERHGISLGRLSWDVTLLGRVQAGVKLQVSQLVGRDLTLSPGCEKQQFI